MISYRSKNYQFVKVNDALVISDEKLATLPKAVLLLLMVGAARGSFAIADTVLVHLSSKVGKYITDGQLNTDGQRVFRNDRELQTALRTPVFLTNAQAKPLVDAEFVESSENPQIVTQSAPTPELDTPTVVEAVTPDAIEKTDPIDNLASVPSVASNASANVPGKPDLAALLTMIHEFLLRFMVFSDPAQAVALALWIAHSWVIDAFGFTPYLFIYSPIKRCGKTRLLNCLYVLVCRPWSIVSGTEATLMRKIDAASPTLLFDEIDTVYGNGRDRSRENLRAVLNAGFVRGATVPRCAGREVIEYSVFCPKAFAGIGNSLPNTVKDRSIWIHLVRRRKDQRIESLRHPDFSGLSTMIVEGLTSWAGYEEYLQKLATSRPEVPSELGDRAADIGEPLLAIAEMAGGKWPEAARSSLVALLCANEDEELAEPGVRLLGAIRDIFVAEGRKQLPTIQILRKLAAREEEEAWTTQWPRELAGNHARGPAAKMATLLRPYGISAGTIRLHDGTTPKGYRLAVFADAFDRYLPDLPEKLATTPQETAEPPPEKTVEPGDVGGDQA